MALPDFSFLFGNYQTLITRKNKTRFNALMSLQVLELLDFDAKAYPFAGNCEIEKFAPEAKKLTLKTRIAFGTELHELTYKMWREDGYDWQIGAFYIDNFNWNDNYVRQYTDAILEVGVDKFIENLCTDSSFSKLGCK